MLFKKAIDTFFELQRRKNENKKLIQKQQASYTDLSLFQAKVSQICKEINMLLDTNPDIKAVITKTDPNSELIIDNFRYEKELEDYIVEKDEQNLEYKLKYKEINL